MDNKANQIIIRKEYFDNIKTAIDSMNSFFASNFKNKDFPVVDSDFQLDNTILTILSWLNNVDPNWISDPSKIETVIDNINEATKGYDADNIYSELVENNNTVILDHINAFIGYKVLQFIADNFNEFSTFVNGIYTFEIFTKPSKYRNVIDIFAQNIPLDEIEDVMGDASYTLFDPVKYVTSVFNNEQIKLPEVLNKETEITRIEKCTDLNMEVLVDESVQEAAEVNYFENVSPMHIKYDVKKNEWVISKQFEKAVNDLVAELRKCDSTEDLVDVFGNNKPKIPEPDSFTSVVIPCILTRVYANPNKYINENYDKDLMNKYTNSYESIIDKNVGAKRFKNYDLFSTFKVDKDGTIKFIEDFLKLNLVNDEGCVIQNNTLLTLFNIFDSRIYLDILYNLLPEDVKKDKYPSEDGFVKEIRARINRNSRSANVYKPDNNPSEGNDTPTSKEVVEYAVGCFAELGDMSITDMQYCEHYRDTVVSEINCLNDIMYNKGTSQIAIDNYVGESYNVFGEGFFSDLFGKKKNKPEKKGHTISELEEMYGTSFPQDFVEGICSEEYKHTVDMVSKTSVKINIGSDTHEITCLADVNKMYDWNSEIAEPGIQYLTFANIGDDDIGVHVKNGTYHIVYSVNEVSKPFAKSFEEFMSKLDTGSDEVQESYVQEQEAGDIPDYMKTRIRLSDESGNAPNVTTTDVQLPPDVPTNPVEDLTTSIDARLNASGGLDDMLGSGYNDNPNKNHHEGKVVYNITNNYSYNNSFNRNSNNSSNTTTNDSSTGKTITTTNTNSNNDKSSNKTTQTDTKVANKNIRTKNYRYSDDNGNNNNNNSNDSVDTNDFVDKNQTFSNGYTVQEMFAFLESEEPLSNGRDAGKPPKGDLLTAAMDIDRKTLSRQQSAKRKVQKVINTGKAMLKPATRTKQWLTKLVDSLIKRDEDRVKAEIIENPSYRTALYKAMRLALKFGLTGVAFTVSGYLGSAYLVVQGAKFADKQRLKKEVQEEFATEIEILNDKIRLADRDDSPESRKAKWQMMRLRSKMERIMTTSPRTKVHNPKSIS